MGKRIKAYFNSVLEGTRKEETLIQKLLNVISKLVYLALFGVVFFVKAVLILGREVWRAIVRFSESAEKAAREEQARRDARAAAIAAGESTS